MFLFSAASLTYLERKSETLPLVATKSWFICSHQHCHMRLFLRHDRIFFLTASTLKLWTGDTESGLTTCPENKTEVIFNLFCGNNRLTFKASFTCESMMSMATWARYRIRKWNAVRRLLQTCCHFGPLCVRSEPVHTSVEYSSCHRLNMNRPQVCSAWLYSFRNIRQKQRSSRNWNIDHVISWNMTIWMMNLSFFNFVKININPAGTLE